MRSVLGTAWAQLRALKLVIQIQISVALFDIWFSFYKSPTTLCLVEAASLNILKVRDRVLKFWCDQALKSFTGP